MFSLENLNGKLIFWPFFSFFLGFPEAIVNCSTCLFFFISIEMENLFHEILEDRPSFVEKFKILNIQRIRSIGLRISWEVPV